MRTPSFIAPPKQRKPRATKAAGAQVAEQQPEPAAQATPDTASHSQNGNSTSRAGSVRKADSTTRKATKRRRNGDEVEVSGGEGLQSTGDGAALPMSSVILAMSARPDIAAELERIRPGCTTRALEAMLDGAAVKGASGAADRGQMWKIMAMPWVGDAGAKQVGTMLGAVLGEAVARLEQHRGRAPVTVDAQADAKALADKAD